MRWLVVAGLLMPLASSLTAADLTGTWIGLVPGRERRLSQDISFQFVQQGNQLRGKLYGESSSSPILEGEVDDHGNVWFVIEVREQAGNRIRFNEYRFTGEICGDGIELTRERVSARDALTGVSVPVRRPDDTDEQDRARRFRNFWLERLF